MRTDSSGKVIKLASHEQQENIKNSRKTLKVIQQAATDKENLVGRAQRSGKDIPAKVSLRDHVTHPEGKSRVKVLHKETQTGSGLKIDVNDLTSEAGPSEGYWESLAEKRRQALDETLDQNKQLIEENVVLREENRICKEMLDESRNLVEVLTEMLNESDSGAVEAKETEKTVEDAEEAKETEDDE